VPDPDDPPEDERRPPADLRRIALYQRLLILCLLAQLLLWVGYVVAVTTGLARDNGEGAVLALIWTAGIGLLGGAIVFLVTAKLDGAALGLMLGALTVIPCLGLVAITAVSTRATAALRANGVRVGLFGARSSDIEAGAGGFDPDEYDW
jgi:hypothetical protein